jgi:hypothetical protein
MAWYNIWQRKTEAAVMVARYKVTLMDEERELLESLTKKGKHNSRTVLLSRALMLCDIPPKGPGWSTKDICEALGLSARTVESKGDQV